MIEKDAEGPEVAPAENIGRASVYGLLTFNPSPEEGEQPDP